MTARRMWLVALALATLLAAADSAWADTPADNDAQFFMLLAYKQAATLGDAYRAVAMLVRGDSELKPAEECRTLLVERGVARKDWGDDLGKPCTKGKLAYMICQALGIKGGLTMRLLGPTERYCLFECQYLELMTPGATFQNVPGGELVSVLDRSDEHRAERQKGAAGQEADATADDAGRAVEAEKPADDRPKDDNTSKTSEAPAANAATAAPAEGQSESVTVRDIPTPKDDDGK